VSAQHPLGLDPAREAALAWCLRLAEGPLGGEELDRFNAWLAADASHAACFDEAVALWSGVEDQAGSPEMVVLRGAALESARQANMMRWARRAMLSRRALATAAMLVVAVLASVWFVGLPQTYRTGVGEREVVALADGSKLSLDADSAVSVRYTSSRRQLVLKQGRARFTVAKNPLRPFTVLAEGKTVVAVGTEFSVERLSGQVRVILYEGKVSVLGRDSRLAALAPIAVGRAGKPADAVLKPGGELIIPDAAPTAELQQADLSRSLSWEGGLLIFKNEPLGAAVERVNRYADRKVRVEGAAAAQVLVSGVFAAGDTQTFVDGVTAVFPVRAEARGRETVIVTDPNLEASVNDPASGASNPSSA
jgi:transmembrane sensor